MSTASAKGLAFAICVLSMAVTVVSMQAVDSSADKPVRLDANGDPLPEGTVARLGTLRLVHRNHVSSVAVSPDGKLLASGVQYPRQVHRLGDDADKRDAADDTPARPNPRGIRIWYTRTGKLLR